MIIIITLYIAALLFIFIYSLEQAYLLFRYLSVKRKNEERTTDDPKFEPMVTVQLPVYNELYVVERLIDAVAQFDYPENKLEIQVLDDSTDGTVAIIQRKVEEWKKSGIDITHIQRENRTGFKAGALKYGLEKAKGEFIAVFDADFIPPKDFIRHTISRFADKKTGMVQMRWEHLNRDYSMLTNLQAFGLDAHFTIEQVGRSACDCFINFNGTGGIWRKACVLDAGNWEADTLTEDLDLSYRAQMKGWKFAYLEEVASPAELPPVMSALKSQQYRWTKGGAETAKKHLGTVLKSNLPLSVKWHALFHLLNGAVFISIIICALTSIPLLMWKQSFPQFNQLFLFASLFLLSFLILGLFYYVSSSLRFTDKRSGILYFLKTFPLFLSVSMGLSLHNAMAVSEGYFGRKTPFIRTPKFNIRKNSDSWKSNEYLPLRADISTTFSLLTISEGLLALYFLFGVFYGFAVKDYGLVPFHLMLAFGFATVFYYSLAQSETINVFSKRIRAFYSFVPGVK